MNKFNYYESQLKNLENGEYFKSIKVFDGNGNSTKQLDLNKESIPVIIEFLTQELVKLKLKDK